VTGAQIGRQQSGKEASITGDSYRHAFLIRESRRSGDGKKSSDKDDVDHILCAESDLERDEWVKVLAAWHTGEFVQPVEPASSSRPPTVPEEGAPPTSTSSQSLAATNKRTTRKVSKDDIARGAAQPIAAMQQDPANAKLFNIPSYAADHTPNAFKHRRDESFGKSSVASSGTGTDFDEPTPTNRSGPLFMRRRNNISELHPSSSLPTNLDSLANSSSFPPRPNSEQGHHNDPAPSRGHHVTHSSDTQATTRPASPDKRINAKISGPMNPAPIGAGFKQNKAEERRVRTKSSFWNFAVRTGEPRIVIVHPRF
jgi:RalA-binding protein 1